MITKKRYFLWIVSFFTKAAAHWLKCNQIMHVGVIQKQRFRCIASSMEPVLEKSGTYCIAHNSKLGETVAFCLSANKNLGKKFVLQAKKRGKKDTTYAIYYGYKQGFGWCINYNKYLASKMWPYAVKSDAQAASNYLFSLHCAKYISLRKKTIHKKYRFFNHLP